MADHPLRPATDRRLGEPLPHQLANPTRAHPEAINLSPLGHIRYQLSFRRVVPYLGVVSLVLLTRLPLPLAGPLDLHVLGLPPAFVLSQDQTLKLNENSSRHLGRTFDEDHDPMKPRNRNPDAPQVWLPWNVNRRSLSSETHPRSRSSKGQVAQGPRRPRFSFFR